jgi:hypothetical protein
MGIIVPEAVLPSSNIAVSNVYMSFGGYAVNVFKEPVTSEHKINSTYSVYSNPEKVPPTNITESLLVPYSNLEQGVYTILYENLKQLYPGSVDVLDVPPSTCPEGMTEEQYAHWRTLVNDVSNYISEHPGNDELESAYNAVEISFLEQRSSDTTNLVHLETLYTALI